MQRWVVVAAALTVGLIAAAARAETCSPAMCAGMSPVCWLAYEQVMVNKESKFDTVDKCKAVAQDLSDGTWLEVKGLTTRQAQCACEAAFWSLDSGMQGLPDIDDTSEEDDNRDSY